MQFKSIKYSDKSGVSLKWTETKGDGAVDITLKRKEKPMLPFLRALAAFRAFVVETLELDKEWAKAIVVTGIALSEGQGGRAQLQVFARRPIPAASNAPVFLNTPLMRSEDEEDDGPQTGTYGDKTAKLIEKLSEAAIGYINGEHEQTEMELPTEGEGDAPKRRGKKGAAEPSEDEALRKALLDAGMDVPVDAVATWTSTERDEAGRWAAEVDQVKQGLRLESKLRKQPKCVAKAGTPSLLETQLAGAGAAEGGE